MERVESFKDWMLRAGIRWNEGAIRFASSVRHLDSRRQTRSMTDLMQPKSTGIGLSVHATRPINEGEELCRIPKQACIAPATCSIGDLLEREGIGGGLALVIAVCHEHSLGKDSKWHGYFLALPQREYLPIFWNQQQRRFLQGTMLSGGMLNDELRAMRDDFTHIVVPFTKKYKDRLRFEAWTFQNFQKAASLVASRAFGIDSTLGDGMVPLADAFNHKVSVVELASQYVVHGVSDSESESESDSEEHEEQQLPLSAFNEQEPAAPLVLADSTTQFSVCGITSCNGLDLRLEIAIIDSGDALQIVAASTIPFVGQEIHNTYGELSNTDLVKKYGFAIRDNPFAVVALDKSLILEMAADVLGNLEKDRKNNTKCTTGKRFKLSKRSSNMTELLHFLENETELLDDDEEPFEVMVNGHIGPALFMVLFVLCWEKDVRSLRGTIRDLLHRQGGRIGPVAIRPETELKDNHTRVNGASSLLSQNMCLILEKVVTVHLSKYPCPLEKTVCDLEAWVAGSHKHLQGAAMVEHLAVVAALTLRASEQKLLHDAAAAAKARTSKIS